MTLKVTIASLLLLASLYGQAASATEVTISAPRLNSLLPEHIQYLANNKLIRFSGDRVLLDLTRLESILKNYDPSEADKISSVMVPYGNT